MAIPDEIERVAAMRWRVYPASRISKGACFRGASAAATHDLNVISQWSKNYPKCNWRVVMSGSGIFGLDIDAAGETHVHDGVSAFAAIVAKHEPLIRRPTLRTGGGGYAIFFHHAGEPIVGVSGVPAPGIDPRRGQQSQTIAPSVHVVTGRPYRWLVPPWEVAPPVAPAWLLALVAPPPVPVHRYAVIDTSDQARRQLYAAGQAIVLAGDGTRNDTLNRRAYRAGRLIAGGVLSEGEAHSVLYSAARHAGLDHHEIEATIRSAFRAGLANPDGGKEC